jgi:hypothetical protein
MSAQLWYLLAMLLCAALAAQGLLTGRVFSGIDTVYRTKAAPAYWVFVTFWTALAIFFGAKEVATLMGA